MEVDCVVARRLSTCVRWSWSGRRPHCPAVVITRSSSSSGQFRQTTAWWRCTSTRRRSWTRCSAIPAVRPTWNSGPPVASRPPPSELHCLPTTPSPSCVYRSRVISHWQSTSACSTVVTYPRYHDGWVAEWLACWTQAQKGPQVQIAAATLSGNSLRQTVHTHRASVHQAAKLVAALLRVAGVTAGLAESNGSLPPGLWLTSPAGWLPRTGIGSGTLHSVIEYGLAFTVTVSVRRGGTGQLPLVNEQLQCVQTVWYQPLMTLPSCGVPWTVNIAVVSSFNIVASVAVCICVISIFLTRRMNRWKQARHCIIHWLIVLCWSIQLHRCRCV